MTVLAITEGSRALSYPAASSPIGGGLIKLGQGSTWAAVAVGMAPYAVCALLFTVFVIGYLAALIRCLCAKPEQQEIRERHHSVSERHSVDHDAHSLHQPSPR